MRDPHHNDTALTVAQQVAQAIRNFQIQRTGHAPKSVTVVLSEGTLVVTLYEILTPAELALARTAEGANRVREFHRILFQSSVGELKREIQRITGVPVREAATEVETATGAVVHVFTSGTMVQVFQLAGGLSAETWTGSVQPHGAESEDEPLHLPVERPRVP
jgi:uncharacterized protein YbcI